MKSRSTWRPAAALLCLGLMAAAPAAAFEINGRHWDALPLTYHINPSECPVLPGGEDIVEIIARATANWCDPVCSGLTFEYLGETDAEWAADGQNTIFCAAQDFIYSPDAAGASLWIPTEPGEPLEVDLALNAADFEWVMGGGDATRADVIDPVAVATHELGHWLGLAHSPDPFASMYYAMLPNGLGATLTGDDVAGVCSLYPSGQDECSEDEDCPDGFTCTTIQDVPVCQEPHDGPGAFCSKDYIDCAGMCWVSFMECEQTCLFTSMDYSEGYCAPLCDPEPCPDEFECTYLDQYDVSVCFLEPDPGDGSDGEDGAGDGGLDGEDDGGLDGADDGPDGQDGAGDDDRVDGGVVDAGPDGADQVPVDAGPEADADDPGDGGGCGCGRSGAAGGWLVFVLMGIWLHRRNPTGS